MKKLLQVILFTVFLQGVSHPQEAIIQTIINETNIDSLVFFVKELSGEVQTNIGGTPYTIVSRHKNQPGNDKAADYIKEKLQGYGLTVYDQWFSATGRNVYAVQPGTLYPNKKYIICAHYDDMPSGTTAPGADDNASGTAAVIEAARILTKYLADYTIIYALWDEEEQGLIGSYYYAQQASQAGDSIMGVVNLDMIAWDSNSDNIADLHTRSVGTSIFLKDQMVGVNNLYSIGLTLDIKNPGSTYSDHAAFWAYNYGAILLIEDGSDFNNYYHTVNDKIQYFNQPYYLKMSKAAIGTISVLANVTTIVPVELYAFTASAVNETVILNWTTSTEINNLGFEIERAGLEEGFITIGFVEGKGTTTETNYYSFTDRNLSAGNYYYRLRQVDFDGSFEYSPTVEVDIIANEFALSQNYPNPFNPGTSIQYAVGSTQFVTMKVYDILGNEVAVLVNEEKPAGSYKVIFSAGSFGDASSLSSGTYFYVLQAGSFFETRKMTLIK
jgi:hypothetical protein